MGVLESVTLFEVIWSATAAILGVLIRSLIVCDQTGSHKGVGKNLTEVRVRAIVSSYEKQQEASLCLFAGIVIRHTIRSSG